MSIIGIDANEANIQNRVGVGQFAYNILKNIYTLDQSNRYFLFLKHPPLPDMPLPRSNWQYIVFGPSKYWTRFALPLKLLFFHPKLDLFFSPSHYSPRPCSVPTIPTIHDIGYLKSLNQFNKKDIYQLVNWTKDSINQAKHLVAVSEFTKSELIQTYHLKPDQISVVYNGIDPVGTVKNDPKVLSKFKLKYPYFLSVGTLKPNKNYPFLIASFAKFLGKTKNSEFQLVIAGKKGWLYDEISKAVDTLELKHRVVFTDYITEHEKQVLYLNASATIIPSTYEGFGIPALESQQIGTPVIASDIPSLREVLAKSVLYIDPYNSETLVQAMVEIIKKPVRSKLIPMGKSTSSAFTWENSAKSLIKLFEYYSSTQL